MTVEIWMFVVGLITLIGTGIGALWGVMQYFMGQITKEREERTRINEKLFRMIEGEMQYNITDIDKRLVRVETIQECKGISMPDTPRTDLSSSTKE